MPSSANIWSDPKYGYYTHQETFVLYLLLLSVIYLLFISLGLPDSLLGAGWPVMHSFFGVPLSSMGIVTMIISGSTILSSLLSERVIRRFSVKIVTTVSVFLTAAALFAFSVSTRFWMICLWAVPYGLGAGSIDAALNNYVALHYSSRHMSWLHCFWGVGTIVSPYVMSFALVHYNWQAGYRIISVIQFLIGILALCALPLWKINQKKPSDPAAASGQSSEPLGILGALRIRGVPQLLTGFMSYCAAESTCMLWTASFLIGTRGISEERAAAFAALFFIGITAGRFLAGFVSDRLGDRKMIHIGTGIALLGILLIGIPFLPTAAALAGCIVIGLGCAPIFPSIIHSTADNFGADRSQAIIGMQMASAYIGSTFMPPLFGVIASICGMWTMPVFIAVFFTLMTVMLELTNRQVHPSVM